MLVFDFFLKKKKITKLSTNQFFGETEIFEKDQNTRICRAIVKSENAEIYSIPKLRFLELSSLLNSLKSLRLFSNAKENWREDLIQKSQRSLSSQKNSSKKDLIQECSEDNFQLISHVKAYKLLDKEISTLKGKKPIRGRFEMKSPKETQIDKEIQENYKETRPFTARYSSNKSISEENRSFESEEPLKLWISSPKNKEKRQKELERKINMGKLKQKSIENTGFSDFFLKNSKCKSNEFLGKLEKFKIYKRLKIDKIFPPDKKFFAFH